MQKMHLKKNPTTVPDKNFQQSKNRNFPAR